MPNRLVTCTPEPAAEPPAPATATLPAKLTLVSVTADVASTSTLPLATMMVLFSIYASARLARLTPSPEYAPNVLLAIDTPMLAARPAPVALTDTAPVTAEIVDVLSAFTDTPVPAVMVEPDR